jgi:EAL domain-containing protein (putative c-di-GMP-specific phosphodiesterase class I)
MIFEMHTDDFKEEEYFLEYQPLFSSLDARITGFEALIRKRSPKGERVLPDDFLWRYEHAGLMHIIDEWVAKTAALQQAEWRRHGHDVPLSINITHQTLANPACNARIIQTIAEQQAQFNIEITEQCAPADSKSLHHAIAEYHELGVKIYLDDFGKAYSSLSLASDFDIDGIKIDSCFMRSLRTDKGQAIMRSLLGIGHGLRMDPIVEGVETIEQASIINSITPAVMQGWLYGRPMPAQGVPDFLNGFNGLPSKDRSSSSSPLSLH